MFEHVIIICVSSFLISNFFVSYSSSVVISGFISHFRSVVHIFFFGKFRSVFFLSARFEKVKSKKRENGWVILLVGPPKIAFYFALLSFSLESLYMPGWG